MKTIDRLGLRPLWLGGKPGLSPGEMLVELPLLGFKLRAAGRALRWTSPTGTTVSGAVSDAIRYNARGVAAILADGTAQKKRYRLPDGSLPAIEPGIVEKFCHERTDALAAGDARTIRAWAARWGMVPPVDAAEFGSWVARLRNPPPLGPKKRRKTTTQLVIAPVQWLPGELFKSA